MRVPRRLPILPMVLTVLTVLSAFVPSRAERFFVAVGNNIGLAGETPLRYAVRDAREIAAVLRASGGFDKEGGVVLENGDPAATRAALRRMSARVKAARAAGRETLALFYYSGHGAADALHMGREKLPSEELMELVRESPADVKVVILDACESGDFLRPKGVRALEGEAPQRIEAQKTRGVVVLSSTARGELAQESEEYGGSVFSHHFRNGLRGLADRDGDGRILLMEAFDYARSATRREGGAGGALAQNPAFDLDLVGESDIVLASPAPEGRLVLRGLPAGRVEIYDDRGRGASYRAWLPGDAETYFRLPAGRYVVSVRRGDDAALALADLSWKKSTTLAPADFRRENRRALRAKGGAAVYLRPNGLEAAVLPQGTSSGSLELGYARLLPGALQTASLAWGLPVQEFSDSQAALTSQFLQLALTYKRPLFDVWRFRLLAGGGPAVRRTWQRVEDRRLDGQEVAPEDFGLTRTQTLASTQAGLVFPLEFETYPWAGVRLGLGLQAGVWGYQRAYGEGWGLRGEWNPRVSLGHRF